MSIPISVGMIPLRLFPDKSLQQTEAHRVNCHRNTPNKENQEAKFTRSPVKDVSILISVEMVPLRLL